MPVLRLFLLAESTPKLLRSAGRPKLRVSTPVGDYRDREPDDDQHGEADEVAGMVEVDGEDGIEVGEVDESSRHGCGDDAGAEPAQAGGEHHGRDGEQVLRRDVIREE